MEEQETEGKVEKKPVEKLKAKEEMLIRIAATDIPASHSVYAGLTKIKGISWTLSNAICHSLNIQKNRKVSSLSPEEIETIESFIKNPKLPEWLLNRRRDIESGISRHLVTTELALQHEFDIRRMKKIKCYKGIRHMLGLPVRGQRTKSHFRKGGAIGVIRTKVTPGTAKKQETKK